MIYFISDGCDVKVGRARSVPRRLGALQTGHARNLHVLSIFDAPDYQEQDVHAAASAWRLRGEWFTAPLASVLRASRRAQGVGPFETGPLSAECLRMLIVHVQRAVQSGVFPVFPDHMTPHSRAAYRALPDRSELYGYEEKAPAAIEQPAEVEIWRARCAS